MYIAIRPCTISGLKYLINDEVNASMLTDKEITALCKRKVIVEAGSIAPASDDKNNAGYSPMLSIPIITKDEAFTVSMTGEQLCDVVTVIQSTADKAIEAINFITEESMLILIHRLDGRKTVQAAAKAAAEALVKPDENPGDE